ncbi:hypothetical protein [Streptococcus varani]|nr:hypothetical protein [Streptococcus varani]
MSFLLHFILQNVISNVNQLVNAQKIADLEILLTACCQVKCNKLIDN